MKWEAFIATVRKLAISATSLDDAIRLGTQYGFLRRLNHDGVYADAAFEEAMYARISDCSLASGPRDGSDVLHILTESWPFGGHTRLALEWIRIRKGIDKQTVLFTRKSDQTTVGTLDAMSIPHVSVEGDPMARLKQIILKFVSVPVVVLHIHPEDCIGALAAHHLRAKGSRVVFVNHADHLFTFGMGAAHSVLEVSGFGWETTRRKRQVGHQSFLGIPLPQIANCTEPRRARDDGNGDIKGPLISVGAPFKYKPNPHASFPDFLNRIAEAVPNEFHLIGPDGTEPWWRELSPHAKGKVQFLGTMPLEAVRMRMEMCAGYVDSFPMTGGSAFQEAFMLGAPSFGLISGPGGYGLVDSLRSNSVDDLVPKIASFIKHGGAATNIANDMQLRQLIIKEFSDLAMSTRISAGLAGDTVNLPAELAHCAGDLQHFETTWSREGPVLNLVPSQVPSVLPRLRLLAAMAFCKARTVNMNWKASLKFAAGLNG